MSPYHDHFDLHEIKQRYAKNENISAFFRKATGKPTNEQFGILISYDLQAGSYVDALSDPSAFEHARCYSRTIAEILGALQPESLLEAGVGEATTLANVVNQWSAPRLNQVMGFDLSWSRVRVAIEYWRGITEGEIDLFVGELEAIPLPANAIDVVFTSHAIEPNHGREEEILHELLRVARRYVVLFEPAYELAGAAAQARMEQHGYCRELPAIARKLGGKVREHRLLGVAANPLNPTGVIVIEKPNEGCGPMREVRFTCPGCQAQLTQQHGHHFCEREGLVYPTIRDIPCLLRSQGIVASRFLD